MRWPRGLLGRLVLLDRCPSDRAMPGLQPGGAERLGGRRVLPGLAAGVDRIDAVIVHHVYVVAVGEDPAQRDDDLLLVAGYRQHGHRRRGQVGWSECTAEPGVFEYRVEAIEFTGLADGRRREDGIARRGFRHGGPL